MLPTFARFSGLKNGLFYLLFRLFSFQRANATGWAATPGYVGRGSWVSWRGVAHLRCILIFSYCYDWLTLFRYQTYVNYVSNLDEKGDRRLSLVVVPSTVAGILFIVGFLFVWYTRI
jgi:hypothetical protein